MPLHPSLIAVTAFAAFLGAAAPAAAGDVAGDFDFYVLALSWSPSSCTDPAECARGFVVHGLWPEYEHGYPDYCRSDFPRDLGAATIKGVTDLMPDSLAAYEWTKHGVCSGLDQRQYFALMRKAANRVAIPDIFTGGHPPALLSPGAIETAFVRANRGLTARGLSVQCQRGAFTEIRVCLTKDLAFRSCADVNADSCYAGGLAVPAPR